MGYSDEYKELVNYLENVIKILAQMGIKVVDFEKQHVKLLLPKEPNINHIGTVYAGSIFSLADCAGGVLFYASFDWKTYYPLLKEVTITFKKPAVTDVTVDVSLTAEEVKRIQKQTDETGRGEWVMDLELKDADGNICAIARGTFQMRKHK